MRKIKVTIQGMHCSSCAKNVERQIGKIDGAKSASVSVITKKGFIEADNKVKDSDIKKAVEKAGYKVVEMEEE